MDGFHRLQDETGIHPEEIAGLPEGRWLVLFLLLYVRDGNSHIDEPAERLGGLGFDTVTPDELHKTMQQLKEEGLVREDPFVRGSVLSGSGSEGKGYELTLAGESYLDFWSDSLEQYGKELGHFLHCTGVAGMPIGVRLRRVPTAGGTDEMGLARYSF